MQETVVTVLAFNILLHILPELRNLYLYSQCSCVIMKMICNGLFLTLEFMPRRSIMCRCVGIGRRGGLKIHCQRWRVGSSPTTGTM